MKKRMLFLILPAFLCADNLKSLLEYATTNNSMVVSKSLTQESKKLDLQSTKSGYFPTLDIGGSYQNLNQKSANTPGEIYTGFASIGVDLYDGGQKSNTIKQNEALLKSANFTTSAYQKELQLSIVQDFYNIKSIEASLEALNEKQIQLHAELERVKKFYEVGSTTKDDVDKLQAAYSNNIYQIDTTKYQILSLKRLFSIKIGKKVDTFEDSTIQSPQNIDKEISDNIKALQHNSNSLLHSANSIDSVYYPKLRLEDTYSMYDYDRTDATHPDGLDNQNKLLLTLNIRLFDNGATQKQRESLLIQKKALDKEIEQLEQIQDINVELALSKIETTKAQIVSAKSSLDSAISAYETISEKYRVGTIDNIAYLDALTVKTNAKAQYKTALNNLQIAYSTYYFYTNKNIQEFTK
ncbi:MAG: TolC family protein [Arcobacteraceae bacterium]